MSTVISEYLANLGLEVAKNYIKDKYDENKIRESLVAYIESQRKYNEICMFSEEIDFQGLIEYIQNNLINDVNTRITSINDNKRREARENIISKAVEYSKAETEESRIRVGRSIAVCIDIIKDFYKKKINYEYYILSSEIIDEINENTNEGLERIRDEIVGKINKEHTPSNYAESLVAQVQKGNISNVNNSVKMLFTQLSSSHPLYPYYGCIFNGQELISKPLIPEALDKYPVRYKFKGPVRLGNKYVNSLSPDTLNYAYRHQLQLVMEIEEAKKYLGNIPDPYQGDAKTIVGESLIVNPPEFPPAFACSIKAKNSVCFEYVLIRTQEILDDGTIIFSNIEQPNVHIRFEFRVNIRNTINDKEVGDKNIKGYTGFTIRIKDATNEEILQYVKFIKTVITEKEIRLHILENNKDLIAGEVDNTTYETGFHDIDEEIDFIERVCNIEQHFGVKLNIIGEIFEREYKTVLMISDLIRNKEIEETWENISISGTIDEGLRRGLDEIRDGRMALSFIETIRIDIFGAHIDLKYMRTYYEAILEDYERIKKIIELSKDGDPIKVSFKAGENDKSVITMNIPEE